MKGLAFVLTFLGSAVALAQPATVAPTTDPTVSPYTPPPPEEKSNVPKRGDFNAGGQARFPSGPDDDGNFGSFNWVAADLKARYYLLKTVTANFNMPLAIIKPDAPMTADGAMHDPSVFGGFNLNLDARLVIKKGTLPMVPLESELGLVLTFGYMREGAMLLSDKDFPLFEGSMKPGVAVGLVDKLKLSSVLDFSFVPQWVFQSGTADSHQAIQVPLALGVGIGSLLKVNAELGIFTGDDYSLSGDNGGRIATGASLDLRIGHILLHAGAGVASLLTGAVYPTISDSFYVDVNAKYAK